MLLGKSRSIRGRIAAIIGYSSFIAALGAGVPWLIGRFGPWGWPIPSSWYGVLLGFVGGAIVLFEMALWPRKSFRALRLVRTRLWMKLHIWLGLVCLPIILVHAGFSFGGPLAGITLLLFLLVTASGIWGLILQQWLPEKILDEAPNETVASQIHKVSSYHAEEAKNLIDALTEAPPEFDEWDVRAKGPGRTAVLISARGEPIVQGQSAVDLLEFRDRLLVPYLQHGSSKPSPLVSRSDAERRFAKLRETMPEDAELAIRRLEELADFRRQWDHQSRLNWMLHGWLVVHLPLSIAMTGLMLVHAVRAMKYW